MQHESFDFAPALATPLGHPRPLVQPMSAMSATRFLRPHLTDASMGGAAAASSKAPGPVAATAAAERNLKELDAPWRRDFAPGHPPFPLSNGRGGEGGHAPAHTPESIYHRQSDERDTHSRQDTLKAR